MALNMYVAGNESVVNLKASQYILFNQICFGF